MKFNVLYYITFISFISCQPTRVISFEILSPAKVSLPAPNSPVLILNCSYLPECVSDSMNTLTRVSSPEIYQIDSMITKNLFDGLFSILNESPTEGLRNAAYLEMRTEDTTGFLRPLSTETAAQLCKENKVKWLVSLEYYTFNQVYDYFYDFRNELYVYLIHKQGLLWRIYSDSGRVVDEYFSRDTLYSEYESQLIVDYLNIKSGLYIEYDLVTDGFYNAGTNYGLRLSPSWLKVYRFLYEMNEKTDSGRKRISEDMDRLKVMSTSGRRTKAYKACYNLAVLCESADDISTALQWIKRAVKLKKTKTAIKYDSFLKKRIKELEILDKQINKEVS